MVFPTEQKLEKKDRVAQSGLACAWPFTRGEHLTRRLNGPVLRLFVLRDSCFVIRDYFLFLEYQREPRITVAIRHQV